MRFEMWVGPALANGLEFIRTSLNHERSLTETSLLIGSRKDVNAEKSHSIVKKSSELLPRTFVIQSNPLMTAFVFGASGSLGSNLVNVLHNSGEVVVGVARSAQPKNSLADRWIRVNDYEHFEFLDTEWTRVFFAFGVFLQAPLIETSETSIVEAMRVNLTSQVVLTKRLLLNGTPQNNQRRDVVFVGSTSAYTGFAGSSVYCASKFALRGFVESLNSEWRETNTRFWLVSMGSMDNEMGRRVPGVSTDQLLSPGEVARDIVSAVVRETSSFQPEIVIRRRWI